MAGQTAGPIETKLDTRTHVYPGSVSGKVNFKVIHVCVRYWQNYETPGKRHLANDYETPSNYTARVTYEATHARQRNELVRCLSVVEATSSLVKLMKYNKYNIDCVHINF